MPDPGRARYSQVQCQKDPSCAIFLKSRRFVDIKYYTERYVWGINWGMSGVLSGACLGHHLGYVWGINWGMSEACLGHFWGMSGALSVASSGACLGHHLGHVSDNIWGILSTMDNNLQSVMPFYCSRFSDKLHSPLPSQCSKLALPTCEPRGH